MIILDLKIELLYLHYYENYYHIIFAWKFACNSLPSNLKAVANLNLPILGFEPRTLAMTSLKTISPVNWILTD